MIWDGSTVFHRAAGRLHENIGLGPAAAWVVFLSTLAGVVLQLSGLFPSWQRKAVGVRTRSGWKVAFFVIHHLAGGVGFPLMLILTLTGSIMAMVRPDDYRPLRQVSVALHTGGAFPWPIKLAYLMATTGFLIQGVTGLVMWWRVQDRPASRR